MFRYIGNKTKLLTNIIELTGKIIGDSGTVVDLMSGTGSVALAYRKQGYSVIASDIMTYSKDHLVAQLLYQSPPSFSNLKQLKIKNLNMYESVLHHLNSLAPIQDYFFREFSPDGIPDNNSPSRKYFTSENAAIIDATRNQLKIWREEGLISENESSVLKHTLILAVNRVANISGTYGYFMSEFKKSSLDKLILRPSFFDQSGNTNHQIIQGFAEDISKDITADLCYIDPPYMKRQYAANYHILETISREDFPVARGKSGLRNWWDQHSKFCTKTKSPEVFQQVIKDMNCKHFLISYSEDGLLSLNQLTEIFSEFGKVEINEISYNRFRSNQSTLPKQIKEYIIEIHKH